jgi:WhiB family redox-sensing transcriptional regulator
MNDDLWQNHAACIDHDADMWFPGPNDTAQRDRAKQICATCPVKTECLEHALAEGERYGIWGGVSIATYVRQRVPHRAVSARCGTRSGYQRHTDRREIACDACVEAERDYQRRRRSMKAVS